MDTVYFDSKIAPGNKDWLHCEVQNKKDGVLRVNVGSAHTRTTMEFPLSKVQRIEYGERRSW